MIARRLHRPLSGALLAVVVAGATLAATACGSDEAPRESRKKATHQRFESRPDLRPPKLAVAKAEAGTAPGYVFLGAKKKGKPGGPMIVDNNGEVVWFHPVHPRESADFRVQRYRGKPVLTWWEGTQPTIGIGDGTFVVMDSSYRRIAEVRAGNGFDGDLHEFLITPRNTALLLAYEPVPRDLSSVGGPKKGHVWDNIVQEVDIASGRVLFEWHSLDHVGVAESTLREPARKASAAAPFDYFHVNSVAEDTDGNLLLSARNTNAVYKIRRRDGKVLWRLGGRKSDFAMRRGTRFAFQHDARREADGTLSLFDNSAMPKVAEHSRAIVLRLDSRAKTASLVREYVHPRRLLSPHQGNAQRLPNGNLLVGWGGQPYVTEFGAGGDLLFDARLAIGDSYRAYRFEWRARPADRPAVAVHAGDDEALTVHVSWNGATDVATWQVLAGDDLEQLDAVSTATKEGFETAIELETEARYLAVRALDAGGRTLGTSRAIDLSNEETGEADGM
ncbi:MAG: arylsulfotransferase family protein [Actinomycetota bacterium]|nr:arylsulfotransferase family protein [Actinomycetota bacterium]